MILPGRDSVNSRNAPFEYGSAMRSRSAISDARGHTGLSARREEIQLAWRQSALMVDASHLGLLLIRGEDALTMLVESLGGAPGTVGQVLVLGEAAIARRHPDEFELVCSSFEAAEDLAMRLQEAPGAGLISILEASHGRAGIFLAGPQVPEVIMGLCALDLSHSQFPDRYYAQAGVAGIRASILRRDRAGTLIYYLGVDRSLGAYFWEELAREVGGISGMVIRAESGHALLGGWPVE